MISFQQVGKSYRNQAGDPVTVLKDLDFTIEEGRFVCVLGPSGCGKTTLLNLIAGFSAPASGQVRFQGEPIRGPGPDRGVVFQDPTLFPWLSVWQNVAFGLRLKGEGKGRISEKVGKYLDLMGLAGHSEKYPHALSGGMRQRVAIARVLALEPKVLLMDEPFSALDENTRERLQDELLRIWTTHRRTVVYVTHSVEEAAYLGDRIFILGTADGGLHADIPVSMTRPRDRASTTFLRFTEKLRRRLAEQPCCIQPLFYGSPGGAPGKASAAEGAEGTVKGIGDP